MKKVRGASTVDKIRFKSERTNLSTVVIEYADYADHFSQMRQVKKYLKKSPSNLSNRRIAHKGQSREGLLLSITLSV